MRPGDEVEVVKGEHQGKIGTVRQSAGWYFSVKFDGEGSVDIHRSQLKVTKYVVPADRKPS